MNKQKLEGFINRYSLGGEVDSVVIKSTDDSLTVRMISDDKSLLGEVSAANIEFPNGSFGIYTTSQLKQFLTVLDDEITVKETPGSLQFSDNLSKINYMLASEIVIPDVPALKELPEFNIEVTLGADVVNRFIKSKGALTESDTFTFVSKGEKSEIILGYSTVNTNRISLQVTAKTDGDVSPISFSARYLKQILMANKDSSYSVLKISTDGLAYVSFSDSEYKSSYYLVQIQ